jgi:CheY-like chemotaxis protein
MPRVVVLAVGYDPVLLETRSQVLEGAGYTVVVIRSLKRAVTEFLEGDFDLIVLCHSIPQDDRQRFADLIRGHSPRTPIAFVSSSLGQYDASADLTIESNPTDLLSGLRELLSRNQKRLHDRDTRPQKSQAPR